MSIPTDSLKDDISFIRTMAERGSRGPILGGAFLAAAGLVFGFAAFLQWGIETGKLSFLQASAGHLWTAASVIFAAVWLFLFFRLRSRGPQKGGPLQFAFGVAWMACGVGIVTLIGAIAVVSWRLHDSAILNANALVAFAFYGVAWLTTGVTARQNWMFVIAAAAFALTLILAYLSNTPEQLLAFGAGLLLTLTVPGVKLVTQAAR